MRLDWDQRDKQSQAWDEWKYWNYIENTKEQFDREKLVALITKESGILTTPDEFGMDLDKGNKLWVVYRDNKGIIRLATSNETYDDWLVNEQVLFVPSGSTNPTIVFNSNWEYVIAAEFLPAGSSQKEIWIYEPPYSGIAIRKIVNGEKPLLARDFHGKLHLFYQDILGKIKYRSAEDSYQTDKNFIHASTNDYPYGFRSPTYPINPPYHTKVQNALFYGKGEGLPKYSLTDKEDFYTVGITFRILYVGSPISGVSVTLGEDLEGVTDEHGEIQFVGLPYNVTLPYELVHPNFGKGNSGNFSILDEFKGRHIYRDLEFMIPGVKEQLNVLAGVNEIFWQGTEYVTKRVADELFVGVSMEIEWEAVWQPVYKIGDKLCVSADLDARWVEIIYLDMKVKESINVVAGINSILWVEVG